MSAIKNGKCPDESGIVAEMLKLGSTSLHRAVLDILNAILVSGCVPRAWGKTTFVMLPKMSGATFVKDFRPIALVKIMYKVYARMMHERLRQTLEAAQPPSQAGFRKGYSTDDDLFAACQLMEKCAEWGLPLWIVSLDLSKAFDRVRWPALWAALREQGVAESLVASLAALQKDQEGQVRGRGGITSRSFSIKRGVIQGCPLSPGLFAAVLQFARSKRLGTPVVALAVAAMPTGAFPCVDVLLGPV